MIDLHKYESKLLATAEQLHNSMSMPIPLGPICRELGVVSVRRSRIQSAPALLVDAASKPKILLNLSAPGAGTGHEAFTSWERFAIAHELGHLVLYRANGPIPAGPSEYWQVEALCDAFARRLLVIDTEVRTAGQNAGDTPTQRLQLSSRMAVKARIPWSAAAQRLGEIVGNCVFFRIERARENFKVVTSTLPKKKAVGQKIKPGSQLHARLCEVTQTTVPVEIDSGLLSELSGVRGGRSGVARLVSGSIRLALAMERRLPR
jgi:hypothetical protein